MSREDPQFKLRLPSDLHEKIKSASESNHRSMNAEMVARLQESFDSIRRGRITGVALKHEIREVSPAVEEYLAGVLENAYSYAIDQVRRAKAESETNDESDKAKR